MRRYGVENTRIAVILDPVAILRSYAQVYGEILIITNILG